MTPYQKFCLNNDCVENSDDAEQFLVFIQDEKIVSYFEFGHFIFFAEWSYWITRELALFRKNPKDNKYEFSTPNLLLCRLSF